MSKNNNTHDISNRILLHLPDDTFHRLRPHFDRIALAPRHVLLHAGAPINHIYFVNRGLVSLIKTMQDGRIVEVDSVGTEGMLGGFALHGIERAILEAVAHVPGEAFRIDVGVLQNEMRQSDAFRRLMHRYSYVAATRFAQISACNRHHTLEERCCRWLLTAHDSARSDIIPITHEFLALLLGVQRSGLSITASILQKAGLIRYTRGRITVIDRRGLEAAACECYEAIRSESDSLFDKGGAA